MSKEMMLFTSTWEDKETFRMLPLTGTSTYIEGLFDPGSKTLVLMSRQTSEVMRMIPRVDESGDLQMRKNGPGKDGKPYKQERRLVENFIEFYVTKPEEIREVVKHFAQNTSEFNIEKYLSAPGQATPIPQLKAVSKELPVAEPVQ